MTNSVSGHRSLALRSISSELSAPTILAPGKAFRSTLVLLPGPQPRSRMHFGESADSLHARSMAGRVRSFRNFSYCTGFHLDMVPHSPIFSAFSLSRQNGRSHSG